MADTYATCRGSPDTLRQSGIQHHRRQQPPSYTLDGDSFSRDIYEFGFDLETRMHAIYPTFNRTWDIDGLRHIVRPVVRYRYYTDPDSEGEIATIERDAFDLNRPLLDLSDLQNTDVTSNKTSPDSEWKTSSKRNPAATAPVNWPH